LTSLPATRVSVDRIDINKHNSKDRYPVIERGKRGVTHGQKPGAGKCDEGVVEIDYLIETEIY
jgi:hypothetical protein